MSGIEAILYSSHLMLATLTAVPELVLDKAEAASIALAAHNVQRHYDMGVTQKAADWAHLFAALGLAYVPRAIAIRTRLASAPPPPKTAPTASVSPANGKAPTTEDLPPGFLTGAGSGMIRQ